MRLLRMLGPVLGLFLILSIYSTLCLAKGQYDDLGPIIQAAKKDGLAAPVEDDDDGAPVEAVPYSKPSLEGITWGETFDGDVMSRWAVSDDAKFTGRWEHVKREKEAVLGDMGLRVGDANKFHGIATGLGVSEFENNQDKPLVISYETKFEEFLECGGAYLKLFHTGNLTDGSMANFNNETPYVLMFGPDKCGSTNKVHVIIKTQNPISGKWTEHHLKNPPRVPYGQFTHQFQLVLTPDNSFSVIVDGKEERKGYLVEEFEPSFTPPEEIDDPEDTKPEDWVDEEFIPDPEAEKPEDWDEDAPRMIPDPEATMPEGWLEDEELMIPDPAAVKPDDWDDEEDGQWVAPLITNPKCSKIPGCGKWQAPLVPNPKYKGKWTAPQVKNPAFKGVWKPKQIANPEYYKNEYPHALAAFNAVGFELWTVQKGALFDNIVVGRDADAISKFVKSTWNVRKDIEAKMLKKKNDEKLEEEMKKADGSVMDRVLLQVHALASDYPLQFFLGAAGLLFATIFAMSAVFRKRPSVAKGTPQDKKEVTTETAASEEEEESRKRERSKSRQRSASRGKAVAEEDGARKRATAKAGNE